MLEKRNTFGIGGGLAVIWLLAFGVFGTVETAVPQATTGAQPDYGIVQGVVTREGTSEPVADVQVTLNGPGAGNIFSDLLGPNASPQQTQALAQALLDEARRGTQVPSEILVAAQEAVEGKAAADGNRKLMPLKATTDSAGRFRIENVPVGSTSVSAQLKGYFAPASNGAYANVVEHKAEVEARKATEVRLEMVPGGTISGRVYSAAGKAMTDLPIQVLRPGYSNGQISLNFVDVRLSDDRGEYRSSKLPPGDYYVLANPRQIFSSAATAGPAEIPIATLYPDAIDLAAAQRVTLRAGDELSNINTRVRSAPAAKISGRIISSLPAGPVTGQRGQTRPSNPALALVPRDSLGAANIEGIVVNAVPNITARPDDGSFEIPNVPPGIYDIFVRLPVAAPSGWGPSLPPARATTPWAIGRTTVEVNGTNVEGVSVFVGTGVDLKGRLIVDGKPAEGALRVSLVPDGNASNGSDLQISGVYGQISQYEPTINSDGSFAFPLLPEGPYRFRTTFAPARQGRGQTVPTSPVASLPETAYVSDIRQGGASVYERGIVIGRSEPDPVDIVVNTNGGKVEGSVTGSDGQLLSRMIVVLAPGLDRRSNIDFYQTVTTDVSGHFKISRIPPGQYTLFASKNIQLGALQNAKVFEKYFKYGTALSVSAGIPADVMLRAIPNE